MSALYKYEIIDLHAHIFPDKVAQKAVGSIGDFYGVSMKGKGTVGDLLESGKKIGVSKYVVHSSATTVEQVRSINGYISGVQSAFSNILGFGTLHPGVEDAALEVNRILSLGLHGVKLHPDFQGFNIDDGSMLPIYEALEGRLPVLFHMGDRHSTASSPSRLAKIIGRFPGLVVIAAHFGGYSMWDEAAEYLIGRNVYMDTSSSLYYLTPERAAYMIRKHGVQKMLFGSDYPMWDHEEEYKRFMGLELSEEERRAILGTNAQKLLGGNTGGRFLCAL